jgi:uncharacterized protein (DUF342 family)
MTSNTTARGDVSISIDEEEVEARLFFTPNAQGKEWSVVLLDALIRQRQIPPVSIQALEQFLETAAGKQEPLDLLIARGQTPSAPVPERVTWAVNPIPEDSAPIAAEVLAAAGPPEVYQTHTERVKKERVVKKPGFLSKGETETYWDEKTVQEKIDVDPTVRETRYAEQGKAVGTITPARPGKSGKNIYGKLLNPYELDEDGILFGIGLEQRKNDIIPLVTGVLRIGSGWADVVPIPQPSWELDLGNDGVSLFLTYTPGHHLYPRPEAWDILADADPPDPAMLMDAAELDAALAEATRTGERILHYPLYRDRNAHAAVEINPERSHALLHLRKGSRGRAPLETAAINQVIKESGVVVNNVEHMHATIRNFLDGPEVELFYTLTEGVEPLPAGDEKAALLAPRLEEEAARAARERIRQHPAFRSLADQGQMFPLDEPCILAWVDRGDEAARIDAGFPGRPGRSIEGTVIPVLPGTELDIRLYRGLTRNDTRIIASQAGLLMAQTTDNKFWGQVLEYRDGAALVDVREDGMEAAVELRGSLGAGTPLTEATVREALAAAGVSAGIDETAITAAVAAANKTGKPATRVAARGSLPVASGGMALTWLVNIDDPEKPPAVTRNTPLADLVEGGSAGRDGWDVGGRVRPAGEGEKERITWDESVKAVENETGTGKRLLANRDGEVAFDGYELQVATLREIESDLGPDRGEISFAGELRITGDVLPGAAVSGGRGVLVGGSVNGALVTSGGVITVLRGIRGMGTCVVRSRLAIDVPFAENAVLLAVADIIIKDRIINCSVKTNGAILVRGEKGRIEGGVYRAKNGLETGDLGGEGGAKTEISFGQDYLVKDQLDQVQREIARITESRDRSATTGRAATLLAELNARALGLKAQFGAHHPAEIRIRGAVWPGVVMESHGTYYEVRKPASGVAFWYDQESGRIREKAFP